MATHVRKLLEQVTDPSTKAAYSEMCFKQAKDASLKAARIAPYAVSDVEATSLERLGITTSPFATTAHTHSADKIIENDCLSLIGSYLPKTAVTHIQLKRSKLHLLNRGPDQDFFANYCHEPKDVLRYGLTHPASCPDVRTEYAVLADTLHFMSTAQLMWLFLKNPNLDKLFATLVLPVECLHKLPSLHPEIYRLEYYKNHFAYMPGGHAGGAYVHSYATLKWLSTGQVGTHTNEMLSFGCHDYLSLEKIETKAAHHIMFIQRRRLRVPWPLPPVWVFQASDYVKLPHIFYPPEANVQAIYQTTLVMRMQAYCFSVKAVSLRDIFAKLRQVIETSELKRYSMADLVRFANYLLFTTGMQQVSDYESFLTKSLLSRMSAFIQMRIRSMLSGLCGKTSYEALLSVVDAVPVPFTTTPVSRPCQGALWFQDEEEEEDAESPTLPACPTIEDLDLIADLDAAMAEQTTTDEDAAVTRPDALDGSNKALNPTVDENDLPETPPPRSPTSPKQSCPLPDEKHDQPTGLLDAELARLETMARSESGPSEIRSPDAPTATREEELDVIERLLSRDKSTQPPSSAEAPVDVSEELPDPSPTCQCGLQLPFHHVMSCPTSFTAPDQLRGRRAGWYSADGRPYSYTGATHASLGWPAWIDEFLNLQFFGGLYDSCLYQVYEEGARIGWHADDEPIFEPDSPILTVNLSGRAVFGVSCRVGSTSITLDGLQAFTMPAGFQSTHKHNVSRCSNLRESATFRVLRKPTRTEPVAQTPESSDSSAPSLPPRTVDLLKLHGFTALTPQHDGEGFIQPVYYNDKINASPVAKEHLSGACRSYALLASHLQRQLYSYTIDNKRATSYMSDVKNNLTGLVLPKLSREMLSSWVTLCEVTERSVAILVIHGAGGAGKSRALQELLRNSPTVAEDTNVIVPTVNLVLDWKKKMNTMDPRRFMTFEKACEREAKEVAVFDDYGKLPAGYIDAYCAIKPTVNLIVLTGDQRQSTYHTSNRDAQSANLSSNVDHFKRFCDYYVNATHRQPRRLANPLSVHAERQFGGSVHRANLIEDHATVLVPAHRTQTALTDLGRNALTYSGCQGLTLPSITIALDNDTPLCSNEVLYTAFSRASEAITFVNTHSDHPDFLAKLDATPYLKTLISGVREDEQAGRNMPPQEPVVVEPTVKTHLPVSNAETFLEDKVESVEDKDTRELWDGKEKTNLMQTQDPVVQLFPHQQAKDDALFKLTIEQRIRLASPSSNMKAIASTISSGDLLFEAYASFMKVPKEQQAFDRELWVHCRQLALRTYLSKPKSNLRQGAARQDPDFPDESIALFNKSQWVKKLDKVGFRFKAGQTISAFKQTTVALTATMALYLRKKREQHQPHNVFIMCEKTPSQFNDFVLDNWDFSRPAYTSDYTQYDQSQDAPFLNFELRKARHFGVPEEVIAFYRFIKTHAKTFVGNLAVMRLSGEGPTFDANTECNIAYDALRFQLADNVRACYAGDDLVRDKFCPERPSWKHFQHLFSLQAKPCVTNSPDFCGWRLTPYGIVKSPIQLYQSLQLAVRLGKMEDVKRSYAIDYTYAYKLGDKLFEIFTEKELEAHQLTTRLLIKKGMRVPETGDHLPTFHITSDRLITNSHHKEMHDAESSRLYLVAPLIREDHMT